MIGQCYLRMGKLEEAIRQFELYLSTYAGGDRRQEVEKGLQAAQEGLKARAVSSPPQPAFAASSPSALQGLRGVSVLRFSFQYRDSGGSGEEDHGSEKSGD